MAETEEERKQLREGLLDQLEHLVREVDMLEGAVGRVPEKLLAEAPPGEERSIKELFGFTARLDEAVHPERVERIVAAEDPPPRLAPADPEALLAATDWADQPIGEVLERVRVARRGFIGTLEAVPPADWLRTGLFPDPETANGDAPEERDLYWMAHALCQQDRTRLKTMTRRLYESHMGPAPDERPEAKPPGDA